MANKLVRGSFQSHTFSVWKLNTYVQWKNKIHVFIQKMNFFGRLLTFDFAVNDFLLSLWKFIDATNILGLIELISISMSWFKWV